MKLSDPQVRILLLLDRLGCHYAGSGHIGRYAGGKNQSGRYRDSAWASTKLHSLERQGLVFRPAVGKWGITAQGRNLVRSLKGKAA